MKMYMAICKDDEADTDSVFIVPVPGMCLVLFSRSHAFGEDWQVDINEQRCLLKDWKSHWRVKEIKNFRDLIDEVNK
jgi:hypothetical protein